MASPSTIVTFTDADGDEFPVRLANEAGFSQATLEWAARLKLGYMVMKGERTMPTRPVRVTKLEEV